MPTMTQRVSTESREAPNGRTLRDFQKSLATLADAPIGRTMRFPLVGDTLAESWFGVKVITKDEVGEMFQACKYDIREGDTPLIEYTREQLEDAFWDEALATAWGTTEREEAPKELLQEDKSATSGKQSKP